MSQAKIDVHINLAGSGTRESGCFSSQKFRNRAVIRFMRLQLGIKSEQFDDDFDQDWVKRINQLIKESPVDYGVVLGFDHIYEPNGKKIPQDDQMVIPMSWVFRVCEENPGLLPGPGINPYRPDALEALDEAIEKKATLIKWLPPAQRIVPSDTSITPFYEKMAKAGLPLLCHTGGERTFKSLAPNLGSITHLDLPLSLGVKVIAAHAATRIIASREKDQQDLLEKMINQYPNLYLDNSGLCNPGRAPKMKSVADSNAIMERVLYGSDWPVPMNAIYFAKYFGLRKTYQLERIRNPIERDIEIKRAFGFNDSTLTKANEVLFGLDRWIT